MAGNNGQCIYDNVFQVQLHRTPPQIGINMLPSGVFSAFHETKGAYLRIPVSDSGSYHVDDLKAHVAASFTTECSKAVLSGWTNQECAQDLSGQLDRQIIRICNYATTSPSTTKTGPPDARISSSDRAPLLSFLREKRRLDSSFTAIDVGGSAGGWSFDVIDALVDANQPSNESLNSRINVFQANINLESEWKPILDHVAAHGKFNFAICTHTLEDLAYPEVPLFPEFVSLKATPPPLNTKCCSR